MKTLKLKKDIVEKLSNNEAKDLKGGTFFSDIQALCYSMVLSCLKSCEGQTCNLAPCEPGTGTCPPLGPSEYAPTCLPPCKDITQTQPTPTEGVECGRTLYYTCNNCQL